MPTVVILKFLWERNLESHVNLSDVRLKSLISVIKCIFHVKRDYFNCGSFHQASLSSNSSGGGGGSVGGGDRPVLMTHKQLVDPFASDDEDETEQQDSGRKNSQEKPDASPGSPGTVEKQQMSRWARYNSLCQKQID